MNAVNASEPSAASHDAVTTTDYSTSCQSAAVQSAAVNMHAPRLAAADRPPTGLHLPTSAKKKLSPQIWTVGG